MSNKKTFADHYWERACGHVKLSDPANPLKEFAQFVADTLYDAGVRDDGAGELAGLLREARRIAGTDARLIAAAPDMLAALEAIVKHQDTLGGELSKLSAVRLIAERAIKKATGAEQ